MNAQTDQVFKRPMSDAERNNVRQIYKNAQKQALPASIFALVLAAIGVVTGAGSFDFSTPSGATTVLIIVVGFAAFLYAMHISRLRRSVSATLNEGQVVVVRGTVSTYKGRVNTSATVVGPLSLNLGKGETIQMPDGSIAEIACVPKLRSAVSINGVALQQPIKLMLPVDLEAKASKGVPAYPERMNGAAVASTPLTSTMSFCPSCGTKAMGLAFCSNCGNKF